ncbi:hypothetical protein QF038_001959 [Pseudarthrobacter sp. W1I19]|uniref:DUF4389 domain-containing protein n=1 Tax=Pseudarthrobacter sp. W1I19 TaxID=3042288 RepID=UPI00277FCBF1|nr:DUF4389 domain-containing protein [Pseudarthrobacter sp. W1I19]MDQ0923451.1 hypothetical protein [Pseudarthrobacter sp. W1I19]
MNTTPAETFAQSNPPPEKMSAAHMFVLIMGDLLTAGSLAVFANSGVLVGLSMLVAGLALIIVGAAGLGRRMLSSFRQGTHGAGGSYPARLEGQLDPHLTRWMWLVKWLLAIPHYFVLAFLGIAFVVVTVAAGVAILFTGRYPASLFQFTVGVMRWNWRVAFYANGVLGTDHYPPFTLAHTDYPATFEVDYAEKLSHWRVLVKSWLLALPHLLIVGVLTGSIWSSSTEGGTNGMSLLGLLVFITAVILLFTGVYRLGLFNLIMGINRWIYRTITYTALMRDDYPPFRLDQGPLDPAARPGLPT